MGLCKTLYVKTRDQWRAWLASHYQSETEIWLVYYKKHSGQPRIPYEHAVEEALCFGWIDSIVKKIDDEKFAQKFTPRRDSTKWSALNRRRVRKLIQEGRMTEAGLAKIDMEILAEKPPARQSKEELDIPRFLKQALKASPKAWESFERLAPSHRKQYVMWIMDAKKEETRARRLREAVALLEQDLEIPGFFKQALKANPKAWKFFQSLAPSERRRYIRWILHAKQAQTRERRVREAVALLEQNKKLGLK
jgi:uncharacterized protein YdeI (YjbR/CyaY-like superfamily)